MKDYGTKTWVREYKVCPQLSDPLQPGLAHEVPLNEVMGPWNNKDGEILVRCCIESHASCSPGSG